VQTVPQKGSQPQLKIFFLCEKKIENFGHPNFSPKTAQTIDNPQFDNRIQLKNIK